MKLILRIPYNLKIDYTHNGQNKINRINLQNLDLGTWNSVIIQSHTGIVWLNNDRIKHGYILKYHFFECL